MDQVRITGSSTGSMEITQECIDFIAEKRLLMETKMISNLEELEEAEKELIKGNSSGMRYVLDMDKIL